LRLSSNGVRIGAIRPWIIVLLSVVKYAQQAGSAAKLSGMNLSW
jgi:hypothetical protein